MLNLEYPKNTTSLVFDFEKSLRQELKNES